MFKKIILAIPELLGVIFGSPLRIKHRWTEFKEDMAEFDAAAARREAAKSKMPLIHGCPKSTNLWGNHNWQHKYNWNGGIYDDEAVSRDGWRCYDCGELSWTESDEEFVKSMPEWLLIGASSMPEEFLEYFTIDQLQKRIAFKHDKKARELIFEQKYCTGRLVELAELAEQGKLTLTDTS